MQADFSSHPRLDRPVAAAKPMQWRDAVRKSRPLLTFAFLLLGSALLVRHFSAVDWTAMRGVLAQIPGRSLLGASALGIVSYVVYCSFDLLGRHTTGHRMDNARVLAIGFVGHACALSMGPAGAGVRFRLYGRHGLSTQLTAALWLFNVFTNWLGFALVVGAALVTRRLALPASWATAGAALQWIGVALLAAVGLYLLACRVVQHRCLRMRGVEYRLPTLSVALLQCALSALNWLLLAGMVFLLLDERAPFDAVLSALTASASALAVVDVPAGLGVMEAVFAAILGRTVGPAELIGALLAYRAIYFVVPLVLASAVYVGLEWDAHARGRSSAPDFKADSRSRAAHCPPPAPDSPAPPSRPPS